MKLVMSGTRLPRYHLATKEQVINNKDWLLTEELGEWDVVSFAGGFVSSSKYYLLSLKKSDFVCFRYGDVVMEDTLKMAIELLPERFYVQIKVCSTTTNFGANSYQIL